MEVCKKQIHLLKTLFDKRHSNVSEIDKDVIVLIMLGLNNDEIASYIGTTVNTVRTRTTAIFKRFDIRYRSQMWVAFFDLDPSWVLPKGVNKGIEI